MLIKFLHMGKHESWKTVSLKGEREINFGALLSPKISRQCRMICHAEDISHAISSSSLVQSLSLLSASCRHISLHRCKCRSLKPLTLLLWSQQTSLSFLCMYFIVVTKSFPLGFIGCFPLWVKGHFADLVSQVTTCETIYMRKPGYSDFQYLIWGKHFPLCNSIVYFHWKPPTL